jgi:2-polyprenyl-3-methyl-5-hydroxy-6-metoxy-1,4-benzoquinol methylase
MDYDPVKDKFGRMVKGKYWPTRIFFAMLHLFFLRAWYVRKAIHSVLKSKVGSVRMLDAGTGFGQFAYWVASKYPKVRIHAVDIKQTYLDRAKSFTLQAGFDTRITYSVDDLTKLQASGPYDLVLSVDVMEHIEEDEKVFHNFFRVLRAGGVVIINTPSDQGGSDVTKAGDSGFIGEHVRDGYSVEDISLKLTSAGFVIDQISFGYGVFGSIAWKISIKWPMLLLNTSFLFALFLPFYYLIILPSALILNALDISLKNDTGTGLTVVAHRP